MVEAVLPLSLTLGFVAVGGILITLAAIAAGLVKV
jgi:hypothetical protein